MDELEQHTTEQWWAKPVEDGRWVIMCAQRWRVPGQRWTAYTEVQRSLPLDADDTLHVLRHLAARTPQHA